MLAIIQARSSSKRFKNKVMHKIKDKPLIWYVIKSIKKSKYISDIIIATSKERSDDLLVKFLKKNQIKYSRGSLNNVAERLCNTAERYKSRFFLRINGDSPLLDSIIINKSIKLFKRIKKENYDLITNIFPRTFPSGQSVEIINTTSLRKILKLKLSKLNQEHVTRYFYKKKNFFKILNFRSTIKFQKKKYSIDTMNDLNNLKNLIQKQK